MTSQIGSITSAKLRFIWAMSERVPEIGELTWGGTHDGKTLAGDCDSRRVWDRSNRGCTHKSRGRGYCYRWVAPRARERHNKRKPEVAADRFPAPVGRGPRKSGSSPRRCRGSAPDTKHGQTAWRPPVSFLSAPASRRPRTIHRPIRYMPLPREREFAFPALRWSMTLALWYCR